MNTQRVTSIVLLLPFVAAQSSPSSPPVDSGNAIPTWEIALAVGTGVLSLLLCVYAFYIIIRTPSDQSDIESATSSVVLKRPVPAKTAPSDNKTGAKAVVPAKTGPNVQMVDKPTKASASANAKTKTMVDKPIKASASANAKSNPITPTTESVTAKAQQRARSEPSSNSNPPKKVFRT